MSRAPSMKGEAPPWVVVGALVVVVAALAWTGWSVLSGQPGGVGPDKKVTPGMYDLRAEAAKRQAAAAGQSPQGGPSENAKTGD